MKPATRTALWKALGPVQPAALAAKRWLAGRLAMQLSPAPAIFDDRSKGHDTLLIILSGHKRELWDKVFPRIAAHTDAGAVDICVVCSGNAPAGADARALAEARGWSFLQAEEDLLAHAQNLAVAAFPQAAWIAKLDEDMFPTAEWLPTLKAAHMATEAEGRYRVGFTAPVIPVNGFGYRLWLELTGTLDAYTAAFGDHPPVSAGLGTGAATDPAVAEWLWRQSAPLDHSAATLATFRGAASICPHRFSIGAFVMRRTTFDEMGGFAVARWPGTLGHEERELCLWCADQSRVILVAHGALVGHFAFGPQWQRMQDLFRSDPSLFD